MKSLKFVILLKLFYVVPLAAQDHVDPKNAPIPVELLIGNHAISVQLVVSKQLKENSKWGYFNVTNFNGDIKNDITKNEFFTQSLLNFKLFHGFSIAAGFTLNQKTGFRKVVGFQYLFANKKWLFIAMPTLDLKDNHNIETFSLLEFKPKLTDKIGLYTRLQGLYILDPKEHMHQRSYMNFRLGLAIKNYQLGVGSDFNWYGPTKINTNNTGIFARIQLN